MQSSSFAIASASTIPPFPSGETERVAVQRALKGNASFSWR